MWPVPFSVERAWSRIASQPILEQVEIFLLAPYRNTFRFRSEIQFIATTNHPTEYTLHMWIMFFLDNKTQLLSTMILAGGRGIVQMGQIAKSRQKLDFKKIVKLTGHTYGWQFDEFWKSRVNIHRKGKCWTFLWKNREITTNKLM